MTEGHYGTCAVNRGGSCTCEPPRSAAPPEPPDEELLFTDADGRSMLRSRVAAAPPEPRPDQCPTCHGTGSVDTRNGPDCCSQCAGSGRVAAPPKPPRPDYSKRPHKHPDDVSCEEAGEWGHRDHVRVAAPEGLSLDVEQVIRIMDLSMVAEGDNQEEAARWILARLSPSSGESGRKHYHMVGPWGTQEACWETHESGASSGESGSPHPDVCPECKVPIRRHLASCTVQECLVCEGWGAFCDKHRESGSPAHNEGSCALCTGWHDAEEAAFMNRPGESGSPTPGDER